MGGGFEERSEVFVAIAGTNIAQVRNSIVGVLARGLGCI